MRWIARKDAAGKAIAGLLVGALGVLPPLPILGGGNQDPQAPQRPHHQHHHHRARIRVTTTGNRSERIKKLRIGHRAGQHRRVVMSLGPNHLPKLRRGDVLRTSAEVETSTTCVDPGRRCIGRAYGYNPRVGARLVLANGAAVTRGRHAVPLSSRHSLHCNQHRPNRNHHCTQVLTRARLHVRRLAALPCAPAHCHVNLIMDAHNPAARPRDYMVLGADRPNGSVEQDKGRINAVLVGRSVGHRAIRHARSADRVRSRLPLTAEGGAARRVLYSVRVDHLRKGDMLVAAARALTGIAGVPYNALFASELILATKRTAVEPRGLARSVASSAGALSEANGFDCTHGRSGYRNPCTTRKVGVLHVQKPPVRHGKHMPLYVNLVTRAQALLASPGSGDHARVLGGGYVKVTRLRP